MRFCANCDTEAEYVIEETATHLCYTCKTAYEWGQAGPHKTLRDVDEYHAERERIKPMDRDELIAELEGRWGIACYDEETTGLLRSTLLSAALDG